MIACKNMCRTAFYMQFMLLVFYCGLSYVLGFQSGSLSRSLCSFAQLGLLIAFLLILIRKNPSLEPPKVLNQGLLFACATSLLMLLFILFCEVLGVFPVLEMLYEGYARTSVSLFENATDVNMTNQQIKKELTPTFLLIFVVVGSFVTGAVGSIFFYLIIKNKSKWSSH